MTATTASHQPTSIGQRELIVLIALLMMPSAQHRTLMIGVTSLRGQYSSEIGRAHV